MSKGYTGTGLSKYIKRFFVLAAALFSLPFIYDVLYQDDEKSTDKTVEILQSSITGYDQGELRWKIVTNHAWATKSRYMYYADKILSGIIYNRDGRVLIDSIEAENVKINTRRDSIVIYDNVQVRYLPSEEKPKRGLHAAEESAAPITIKSDELRFYSDVNKTYLNKNVQLIKEDTIIKPKKSVEIDNEDNIAYISNGFNIEDEEFNVSGNAMTIYIDDNLSEMSGGLVFEQLPSSNLDASLDEQEKELRKEHSFLYSDSATFKESENANQLFVSGNVRLEQSQKILTSQQAIYDQSKDSFQMSGYVDITLDSLDWLLDEETKADLQNDDIQQSVFQKTHIRCNKLIFDSEKKQTKLLGNVEVVQPDKIIYCKKLILHDETAIVECFGNVRMIKENNDMIQTEYLVMDLIKETFEAKHGVYSEYHLD